jgi:hypothetical protein
MRITESTLRRIIREEAKKALQEMPYAGSLGIRRGTDDFDPGNDEDGYPRTRLKVPVNTGAAEKFARSGRFQTQAKKLYANFPNNVWIASYAGDSRELARAVPGHDFGLGGELAGELRVLATDLVPDGIKILDAIGFEAPARVGGDDLVILHSISGVDRETLSTPWMIFHSMFDDSGAPPADFIPSWDDLGLNPFTFESKEIKFKDGSPVDFDSGKDLGRIFTMGSARSGQLNGSNNVIAEAMCQELLTRDGFNFKPDDLDDESVQVMEDLLDSVRQAADEFRENTRGKLLTVATS